MTIPHQAEHIRNNLAMLKKHHNGMLRQRNAAMQLGITEAELVAAHVGFWATRLIAEPESILKDVLKFGEVMALTRNEACVHERKGVYDNVSFFSHGKVRMGLLLNPDIDLRLFMNHWAYCFGVCENARKSLQFFDKSGEAVHKIYLTKCSDESEYDKLITKYLHPEQKMDIEIEGYTNEMRELPDMKIDWKNFRHSWENLKDTHDFFPMLRKFKVGRTQALRNIGEDFAYPVKAGAVRQLLELARDKKCEIMVFVGNRGCIQIHTGEVHKLAEYGNWYNVLDEKFNLHLREDSIAQVWVTKKPTTDGMVTALEVFDRINKSIVTFFGKRKPGIPELALWREIIDLISLDAPRERAVAGEVTHVA